MNKTLFIGMVMFVTCSLAKAQILIYKDTTKSVTARVKDLLKRMTPEEKIKQLESELFIRPDARPRDYSVGNIRDIVHVNTHAAPSVVASTINTYTRKYMAANRLGIPVLQHDEALHGAEWGMCTVFPQSIAMAASFDDSLYYIEAKAVTQELRAVGIRQVLAPVVNIARDPRWGRMQETYGEDVFLSSRMGLAYTKALQQGGVIATPKHFVDNYGTGGHDSYASETSWRSLYETYLEPFRVCVQEGGALSLMASYNSIDGQPASSNYHLLTGILRKEWGFKGFVVSDYSGVYGLLWAHGTAGDYGDAEAQCLQAGMEVELANGNHLLDSLYKVRRISIQDIDLAAGRVLAAKIKIGLFDHPFADSSKADAMVRNAAHRALALQTARETMTLLKNDNHTLPLDRNNINRIGILGPAADVLSMGDYTGPGGGWQADGAMTPYQGLLNLLKDKGKVKLYKNGEDLRQFAQNCDVLIYFAAIQEGEAQDHSNLALPSIRQQGGQSSAHALIVNGTQDNAPLTDQEGMIKTLTATGKKLVVVLLNGSPIDMRSWYDKVPAILEAWYPGEQGGTAIAETLFGDNNPGGRLPVSWPKSVAQIPLWYAIKPSGRGSTYIDDDGKPLFPFGYGLSYTTFSDTNLTIPKTSRSGKAVSVQVTVTNTGKVAGDEVVQLYLHRNLAPIVVSVRELKAFKRVRLNPGESRTITLELPARSFGYYDQNLHWVEPPGDFDVWISRNAEQDILKGKLELE